VADQDADTIKFYEEFLAIKDAELRLLQAEHAATGQAVATLKDPTFFQSKNAKVRKLPAAALPDLH